MIFIGDDEKRLIKRLHDGDKAAVKEFHSLYAEYLAGVCSRYIADEEDLKDVFQIAGQAPCRLGSRKWLSTSR